MQKDNCNSIVTTTMEKSRIPASVGILTLNSARHLARALTSVELFADTYICDGNSTDGTQETARAHGARVVQQVDTDEPEQKVTDFGAARTKCLNAAQYDWYVRLDSDEYLSHEAVEEIRSIVLDPHPAFRVYKMPRKYVWQGKVIDDTITYPNRQIRFFKRSATLGYTKIAHERIVLRPGEPVGLMRGTMLVPLPESYDEFDGGRLKRALDWDRRHYEASMTFRSWLWAVIHTGATLALFTLRFARVRFISRGNTLPIRHELWRFKYLLMTLWLATSVTWRKLLRI